MFENWVGQEKFAAAKVRGGLGIGELVNWWNWGLGDWGAQDLARLGFFWAWSSIYLM